MRYYNRFIESGIETKLWSICNILPSRKIYVKYMISHVSCKVYNFCNCFSFCFFFLRVFVLIICLEWKRWYVVVCLAISFRFTWNERDKPFDIWIAHIASVLITWNDIEFLLNSKVISQQHNYEKRHSMDVRDHKYWLSRAKKIKKFIWKCAANAANAHIVRMEVAHWLYNNYR